MQNVKLRVRNRPLPLEQSRRPSDVLCATHAATAFGAIGGPNTPFDVST